MWNHLCRSQKWEGNIWSRQSMTDNGEQFKSITYESNLGYWCVTLEVIMAWHTNRHCLWHVQVASVIRAVFVERVLQPLVAECYVHTLSMTHLEHSTNPGKHVIRKVMQGAIYRWIAWLCWFVTNKKNINYAHVMAELNKLKLSGQKLLDSLPSMTPHCSRDHVICHSQRAWFMETVVL